MAEADPREVIMRVKTIAVVGASKNPEKDAFTVPAFLKSKGYTIVPVNPTADAVNGDRAYPDLVSIPLETASRLDAVDVFRPSEELPAVATQVVELSKRTGRGVVFWAQLGLDSPQARDILDAAGVDFVMDRCMRTVHMLSGGK